MSDLSYQKSTQLINKVASELFAGSPAFDEKICFQSEFHEINEI